MSERKRETSNWRTSLDGSEGGGMSYLAIMAEVTGTW